MKGTVFSRCLFLTLSTTYIAAQADWKENLILIQPRNALTVDPTDGPWIKSGLAPIVNI